MTSGRLRVGQLLAALVISTAALAVDSEPAVEVAIEVAPDLTGVRAKLKVEDFKGALAELTPLAQAHRHADVYNLMGFSLRKTGDLTGAQAYYVRALELDPAHKGALEYQGELYVQTGQMESARGNLRRLQAQCPAGCDQLAALQRAIAAAKTN